MLLLKLASFCEGGTTLLSQTLKRDFVCVESNNGVLVSNAKAEWLACTVNKGSYIHYSSEKFEPLGFHIPDWS